MTSLQPTAAADMHAAEPSRAPAAAPAATGGLARVSSRIVFAGLLLLLLLSPVPYGAVEAWWVAAFECAVFGLTMLWLIDWLGAGRLHSAGHLLSRADLSLLAPLCALTLYALAQSVPLWPRPTPLGNIRQAISFDPYETRLVAVRLLALTLGLGLLLRYTNSLRRLRALGYAVIGIGVASAVFGLIRQVAQRGAGGFMLAYLPPGSGYAQFINKNHFAFLAELTLGLLAGFVVSRGGPRGPRLVAVALAVAVWAALVLSNSRGGVLALLCQAIFLALNFDLRPQPRPGREAHTARPHNRTGLRLMRLALACALGLSIVIGMIWVGGDPLADRIGTVREELHAEATDTSQTGRAGIWRATWRLCMAHPLLGVGFGGYWIAITQYHDGSGALVPQQAHNDYLELWAAGGLFGVALAGWFGYALLSRARQQLAAAEPARRAIALGALTGLFGVAVHSLVDFGLHLTGIAFVAVAVAALAIVQLPVGGGGAVASQKTIPSPY